MSMKKTLLVLGVVSTAFFVLPAVASAQEIHLEPAEFFGISGAGGELRSSAEEPITCTSTGGSGKPTNSSGTTGEATLDFTGCHTSVFSITASCKSEGAATAGTIASGGTYHLIQVGSTSVPGVLLTTNLTKITCAGISTITTTGNVIGTITSPKCGGSSKTITLSFTATSVTQNHLTWTGGTFDLTSQTGSGAVQTSALVGSVTNTQANPGKLNCT
jgi:hypothetical protein